MSSSSSNTRRADELEALRRNGLVKNKSVRLSAEVSKHGHNVNDPQAEAERRKSLSAGLRKSRLEARMALRTGGSRNAVALSDLNLLYKKLMTEQRAKKREAEKNLRQWKRHSFKKGSAWEGQKEKKGAEGEEEAAEAPMMAEGEGEEELEEGEDHHDDDDDDDDDVDDDEEEVKMNAEAVDMLPEHVVDALKAKYDTDDAGSALSKALKDEEKGEGALAELMELTPEGDEEEEAPSLIEEEEEEEEEDTEKTTTKQEEEAEVPAVEDKVSPTEDAASESIPVGEDSIDDADKDDEEAQVGAEEGEMAPLAEGTEASSQPAEEEGASAKEGATGADAEDGEEEDGETARPAGEAEGSSSAPEATGEKPKGGEDPEEDAEKSEAEHNDAPEQAVEEEEEEKDKSTMAAEEEEAEVPDQPGVEGNEEPVVEGGEDPASNAEEPAMVAEEQTEFPPLTNQDVGKATPNATAEEEVEEVREELEQLTIEDKPSWADKVRGLTPPRARPRAESNASARSRENPTVPIAAPTDVLTPPPVVDRAVASSQQNPPAVDRVEQTRRFYDVHVREYVETSSLALDAPLLSSRRDAFLSRLPRRRSDDGAPAPSSIVDLGCGAGRDVLRFSSLGHRVLGTDQSGEALGLAARGAPDAHYLRGDARVVAPMLARDSVDGVWARESLCHLSRADAGEVLRGLRGAVRDGGALYASLYRKEEEEEDGVGSVGWEERFEADVRYDAVPANNEGACDSRYKLCTYYTPGALRELLEGSGWEVTEAGEDDRRGSAVSECGAESTVFAFATPRKEG